MKLALNGSVCWNGQNAGNSEGQPPLPIVLVHGSFVQCLQGISQGWMGAGTSTYLWLPLCKFSSKLSSIGDICTPGSSADGIKACLVCHLIAKKIEPILFLDLILYPSKLWIVKGRAGICIFPASYISWKTNEKATHAGTNMHGGRDWSFQPLFLHCWDQDCVLESIQKNMV